MHVGTLIWVIVIAVVVVAGVAMTTGGGAWEEHGKGAMVKDRDKPSNAPRSRSAAARERDAEIRAMLEARNARRARRGQQPQDIEQELARLRSPGAQKRIAAGMDTEAATGTGPPAPGASPASTGGATADSRADQVDPELREEVRGLVLARNHRRMRAGKEPLDVEAEVERELQRMSDL